MKFLLIIAFLSVLFSPLHAQDATSQKSAEQKNQKVRLVLGWKHQAQFAGIYMAAEKGYFTEENLDVKIIPTDETKDNVTFLKSNEADFAIMFLSTALDAMAKDSQLHFKLVGQHVQVSNCCILAWKQPIDGSFKPIEKLHDLDEKTMTLFPSSVRVPYLAAFASLGIHPNIQTQYITPSLFLYKSAQACAVMYYNEYKVITQRGVRDSEILLFRLSDNGIDIPEDGLYCTQKYYQNNPQTATKMERAIAKGWAYARDNQEETLDVTMRYCRLNMHAPMNRPLMHWMLQTMLESIYPEDSASVFGKLDPKQYRQAVDLLDDYYPKCAFPDYAQLTTEDAR